MSVEYINYKNDYRVGSDGTVWSRKLRGYGHTTGPWFELKPKVTSRGYHEVKLSINNKREYWRVNRLVATLFHGDPPDGKNEANHINGVKSDNSAKNVEWVSRSGNELHAYRTGLKKAKRGEEIHNSRLSEKDVIEIKNLISMGERVGIIARAFDVHQSTISDIKTGRTWTYLNELRGVS